MTFKRARSKEHIEERYQSIMKRTKTLFMMEDYEDITLVSIAKELNISRTSFYNYFQSKEELFLALLKEEYLSCEEECRQTFTTRLEIEIFAHKLVTIFLKRPLFIKLLSLHASALENKAGYTIMEKFKKDTLPFFKTLPAILCQQFPNAKESDIWLFIAQFNLLITCFYQYSNIPSDQVAIMMELKTFGDAPLLTPEDFFTQTVLNLMQPLI